VRAALLPLALLACTDDRPTVWPETVAHEVDHAWVWRGFRHDWLYNHRWSQLGSGVFVDDPDRPPYSVPPHFDGPDAPAWGYLATAGAGTGRDVGAHVGAATRIEADGARFVALTRGFELRGVEGERTTETIRVKVPGDGLTALGVREALLDGFWLAAGHSEAKSPEALSIHVDRPIVEDGELVVDVHVALELDCDTPECNGCSVGPEVNGWQTRFHYFVTLSLLVVAGDEGDVEATRFDGPDAMAAWEGPPSVGDDGCLAPGEHEGCFTYRLTCGDDRLADFAALADDVGRATVAAPGGALPVRAVGITGVELDLDEAHHMQALALSAGPLSDDGTFEQDVRFANWRHDMNRLGVDVDVRASTAFGTAGAYEGRLSYTALGFRDGARAEWSEELPLVSKDVTTAFRALDDAVVTETGAPR
jgi:hypothetical protein